MVNEFEWLIEDIENLFQLIDFMDLNELKKALEYVEKAKDKLNDLEASIIGKISELKEEKEEIKEMEEETEETETKSKSHVKELTPYEALVVALSKKPNLPERLKEKVRKEAEKIIKKYNLTPEDVERLYEAFFE